MLFDKFGRNHNYLRISITDHCNFRCNYCMPELCPVFLKSNKLMSASEIENIAKIFVKNGISKIRLTGGEPLLRKDFDEVLKRLSLLNVELLITTNGSLIHKYIDALKNSGVTSVNVSLDTLNPNSFHEITKRNAFNQVWANILLLLKNDFKIKINTVAIKGLIEKELHEFINLTKIYPLHVRFIEFMPFSGNSWTKTKVITADEMLSISKDYFDIIKLKDEPNATAKKYKVIGHEGTFAFITTMSKQFCGDCNRLRLTAEGKMKNCLFGKYEVNILQALRNGENVEEIIFKSVKNKFASMGGQFENGYEKTEAKSIVNRTMVAIGG